MGSILIKLLVFQFFVAVAVIVVLKKILDHQLEELAVKKLECLKLEDEDKKLEALTLVAPGKISLALQKKVAHLCVKKFGRTVKVILKTDKSLKGGLVIRLNKAVIDYSLIGRLKEGGIVRTR